LYSFALVDWLSIFCMNQSYSNCVSHVASLLTACRFHVSTQHRTGCLRMRFLYEKLTHKVDTSKKTWHWLLRSKIRLTWKKDMTEMQWEFLLSHSLSLSSTWGWESDINASSNHHTIKFYIHGTKLSCSLYIHFLIILISASYRLLTICIIHLIDSQKNTIKSHFARERAICRLWMVSLLRKLHLSSENRGHWEKVS
jgi:hypothetical protein